LNNDPFYEETPYYFKDEEELMRFLHDEEYEKSEDKKGMCFVIKIEENISGKEFEIKGEPPKIDIKFISEAKDGLAPSMTRRYDAEIYSVQQILPGLAYPSYDKY
jgi:hypothetical protein